MARDDKLTASFIPITPGTTEELLLTRLDAEVERRERAEAALAVARGELAFVINALVALSVWMQREVEAMTPKWQEIKDHITFTDKKLREQKEPDEQTEDRPDVARARDVELQRRQK